MFSDEDSYIVEDWTSPEFSDFVQMAISFGDKNNTLKLMERIALNMNRYSESIHLILLIFISNTFY